MMMNLNNAKNRTTSYHLLDTLGTNDPDITKLINFILHTVYNRPLREKSATDSRVVLEMGRERERNGSINQQNQFPQTKAR